MDYSTNGTITGFVDYCFRFVKQTYGVPLEKSIELIQRSGGRAFLAHPKLMKLDPDEEFKVFKQMK
ncbi:hypothetical protein [Paenibacillus periandrae]|uniref:hypothetical protein n=1 Tax=Paenibacillus periandrae TaxID=1761741 RepID=UPI001F08A8A7|nr:hypothetical protein [Paenibacillus periandrae]